MFPFLPSDPLTSTWLLALLLLGTVMVVVPLLRLLVALLLHAYAALSGRRHLHQTAAAVMPRTLQLVGSLVIGVTGVAAPAIAAAHAPDVSAITLDRDAGAGQATTARPTMKTTEAPSDGFDLNLDRDAGAGTSKRTPVVPQVAHQSSESATRSTPHTSQNLQQKQTREIYVVRAGDSLWSIAQEHLEEPTDSATTEAWKAIWRANRTVIGEHPELIFPGQELRLPPEALA